MSTQRNKEKRGRESWMAHGAAKRGALTLHRHDPALDHGQAGRREPRLWARLKQRLSCGLAQVDLPGRACAAHPTRRVHGVPYLSSEN